MGVEMSCPKKEIVSMNQRAKQKPWVALLALLLGAALLLSGCGADESEVPPSKAGGFTFLEMGSDTVYSRALRDKLKSVLDSGAIITKTPIDLTLLAPAFLADYFPELDALNRQFNRAGEARIEHDTILLFYRHARRKAQPFDAVELLFSQTTGQPLSFKIKTDAAGEELVDAMKAKHGEPTIVKLKDRPGEIYSWQYQADRLVMVRELDRRNNVKFHIGIYYVDHLNALLEKELEQIEKERASRRKAGEKAF